MKSLLAAAALLCLSTHAMAASCVPKPLLPARALLGVLPDGVSTRYGGFLAYLCELPTGYEANVYIFGLEELGTDGYRFMAGLLSPADALAKIDAGNTHDSTPSEAAFLAEKLKAITPNAVAAYNGAKTTRSVYAANADGTLNPTPIAGSSIAVAASCNPFLRIAGTQYYSVKGQTDASQSGGKTLGDAFSVCIVSLPLPAN